MLTKFFFHLQRSHVLLVVAAIAATCSSLPETTEAVFFGAENPACDVDDRRDDTCGSIGSGTCNKKRKRCYDGKANNTLLCKSNEGGDSNCDGTGFCADEDHDATSTTCKQPGN